jgi:hypothetical protein
MRCMRKAAIRRQILAEPRVLRALLEDSRRYKLVAKNKTVRSAIRTRQSDGSPFQSKARNSQVLDLPEGQ